jgi:glucose-1-phosphate thymidylyltransferase
MKCLILAGGFATRLYPLTEHKAKALLEYKGKPVISHIVERLPIDMEIIVSTNKKFEEDFLNWKDTVGRPLNIVIEETMSDQEKKGAVGAIDFWVKERGIGEHLLVIAADNYFELDINEMISRFNGNNVLVAVHDVGSKEQACEIDKACEVGLVLLEENVVRRLDEKPEKPTSSIVATGIYVLPSRIFPVLSDYCGNKKQDNMGSFVKYLLEREEVHAFVFSDFWADIGFEIQRGNVVV